MQEEVKIFLMTKQNMCLLIIFTMFLFYTNEGIKIRLLRNNMGIFNQSIEVTKKKPPSLEFEHRIKN